MIRLLRFFPNRWWSPQAWKTWGSYRHWRLETFGVYYPDNRFNVRSFLSPSSNTLLPPLARRHGPASAAIGQSTLTFIPMRRFSESFSRVTTRTIFLGAALVLGLFFRRLPTFLNLDAYRPQLTDFLEKTFHCRVIVGPVRAELIPYPGLVVSHVVFLEPSRAPRVLASAGSVHLWISKKALLQGRLKFWTVRFLKPRFIFHRETGPKGDSHWTVLTLPKADPSDQEALVTQWEVTNGILEIWDHTQSPTSKWVIEQLNGSFEAAAQTGALAGRTRHLGLRNIFDIHYAGAATFPIEAHLSDVDLNALESLMHIGIPGIKGFVDCSIKTQLSPTVRIQAIIHQRIGPGSVAVTADQGAQGSWRWTASGKEFTLEGTAFRLPEWSAKGNSRRIEAKIHAVTAQKGTVDVLWSQAASEKESALEVSMRSVTLRQILEIFDLQSKAGTASSDTHAMNPYGYEPWLITQGSMQASLLGGHALNIKQCRLAIAGMSLDLAGIFPLSAADPAAHIQGSLRNIPVADTVESFFSPPSPISGVGQADFTLTFPLSDQWVRGLNGPLHVQVTGGVLRFLKTFYRITSLLSLDNYLRLRFPQVTARGIVFDSIAGNLMFKNGVLSSDDLFLKSRSMNLGAKGTVDIPAKRIKTTLRIELFRFLEDLFKVVPITHWIFKKPNKILFPLVATVEGPWDDVNVL